MNPDSDEQAIKTTQHLQEILMKGGLISRAILDENTMRFKYDWTADGIAFRSAVLKAHDAIAKTEGANSLREFSRLIAFVLDNR